VWGCDVYSELENGILVPGYLTEPEDFEEWEATGWEEAYKKFPDWRASEKLCWSEATFPPNAKIIAFARMRVTTGGRCTKLGRKCSGIYQSLK
jgi:hypothetical protein